jgi:hypothetical protein
MPIGRFDVVDQALTNVLIGVGFALLNLLFCYFVKGAPRVIKVIPRQKQLRALIFAYLIALVLQMVTSPFFRSLLHSVYVELAWSPYQALFNLLGVVLVDLIVMLVNGVRQGAQATGRAVAELGERAAELGDDLRRPAAPTDDAPQAQTNGRVAENSERKQRLDDRLGDY